MTWIYPHLRWFVCVISVMSACSVCAVAASSPSEYGVKSAFIYNFAKFVEWPSQLNVVNLCVLGKNPFGDAVNELNGRALGGRKFAVTFVNQVEAQCNIVFISTSEKGRLDSILEQTQNRPILTVGDTVGFAQQGVMINFYLDANDTVRFEIHQSATMRSDIKLSSKLIQLGKIVGGGK